MRATEPALYTTAVLILREGPSGGTIRGHGRPLRVSRRVGVRTLAGTDPASLGDPGPRRSSSFTRFLRPPAQLAWLWAPGFSPKARGKRFAGGCLRLGKGNESRTFPSSVLQRREERSPQSGARPVPRAPPPAAPPRRRPISTGELPLCSRRTARPPIDATSHPPSKRVQWLLPGTQGRTPRAACLTGP